MIQAIELILALSLLVMIHELGHYMFARIFHVRVNKFYMFFNWKFSIMRFRKIDGKWKVEFFAKNLPEDDQTPYEATEWGLGWIPLGGYCAIAGMVDETQSADKLQAEPQPWEYRSQKAWKRLLIISGGVLMNFIGAIIIYIGLLFVNGEEYLPIKNGYLGYDYCQTAKDCGFEDGDIILAVNGQECETTKDITEKIIIEGNCNITVLRDSSEQRVLLPTKFGEMFIENNETALMQFRFPFTVGEIVEGSPAQTAGLAMGDSIMKIDSTAVLCYTDFVRYLEDKKSADINLTVARKSQTLDIPVTTDTAGKIGFSVIPSLGNFKFVHVDYNLFEAIPAGCRYGWETLVNYIKQFRLVFTKAGAKSVGGFIAIGKIFPETWSWTSFWSITAFISVILAFMNILPIPVLDGGYFLMILVEMLTGHKPSDKAMNIAMNIGMALLLLLLIYANGNDILKLIFNY